MQSCSWVCNDVCLRHNHRPQPNRKIGTKNGRRDSGRILGNSEIMVGTNIRSCNALCRIWIDFLTMGIGVEKLSAVTLKVADMTAAVRFYRDVLGMELLYGGPNSVFSSLRLPVAEYPIVNLEIGHPTTNWGRIIFHVADVDSCWRDLRANGFDADPPKDANWGERYFHMRDPDGHELSFARPLAASTK